MSDNMILTLVFILAIAGGLGVMSFFVELYAEYQIRKFHRQVFSTKDKMGKFSVKNKYHI